MHRRNGYGEGVQPIRSALGNSGEAVGIQQGDGPSIEGQYSLITKDAEQSDGGFHRNAGHLRHFFPFEGEANPDMIVVFFTESIAEIQQQSGQSFASGFESELIEMIHVDPDFVAEELDQLNRQLGISLDDSKVACFIDDADLRRFQCLAGDFVEGPFTEDVFLDQLTRPQDADDLPTASR